MIFCDNGTIEINDYVLQIKKADSSVESEDFGDGSGFYEEFLNFYSAITAGEKVISDFEKAYGDLKIIMTMLDSAEKNKIIKT